MIAAFKTRFPDAPADCSPVETSSFFNRTFDAVIAWGLLFLLTAEAQALVIHKVALALNPIGSFLFTSPRQACTWTDARTGCESVSLGYDAYLHLLRQEGLEWLGEKIDEGENYYYLAAKP